MLMCPLSMAEHCSQTCAWFCSDSRTCAVHRVVVEVRELREHLAAFGEEEE